MEHKPQVHTRWPRSYLRRQGHATRAQKRAVQERWPDIGLNCEYNTRFDLDAVFGREGARTILEIGFGMGDNLVAQAQAHPEWNFLGVEVHRPGHGATILKLDELGLTNIRLVRHDVLHLLQDHLEPASLDEVYIFFPEPWPRPKDVRKRLVRPFLLELLESRLRGDAIVRVATDIADYAEHSVGVFEARDGWTGGRCERPDWRPETLYESKGRQEGRGIHDLLFSYEGT